MKDWRAPVGFSVLAALMMHLPLIPKSLAPLPFILFLLKRPSLRSRICSVIRIQLKLNLQEEPRENPGLSRFWSQSELRLWSVALGPPPAAALRSIWLVYTRRLSGFVLC